MILYQSWKCSSKWSRSYASSLLWSNANGTKPQEVVKQYQKAGCPAIKMSMIEEKVISKLLDEN